MSIRQKQDAGLVRRRRTGQTVVDIHQTSRHVRAAICAQGSNLVEDGVLLRGRHLVQDDRRLLAESDDAHQILRSQQRNNELHRALDRLQLAGVAHAIADVNVEDQMNWHPGARRGGVTTDDDRRLLRGGD